MEISFEQQGNPCKHLLRCSPEERNLELAYFTVGNIALYRAVQFPSKPAAYIEMCSFMSTDAFRGKSKEVRDRYYRMQMARSEIKEYLEEMQRIGNENNSNLYWLKEVYEWIPTEDVQNKAKVQDAMQTHT